MHFYIADESLDSRINEIKRKIVLSMNGVVADKMKESGIKYKSNYGIGIPRVKEIAKAYEPDSDLAFRLWVLGIRETMIMSTLLQPVSEFTFEQAFERVNEIEQPELVEQITMNLLSRLAFAPELVIKCIASDKLYVQMTGFLLATRVYMNFSSEMIDIIIDRSFEMIETSEFQLYKSIAFCLGRFCRTGDAKLVKIKAKTDSLSDNKPAYNYLKNEVENEILFLKKR